MGFSPVGPLKLVRTELVANEVEMQAKHDLFVSAGFEGVMLRNREGMYKFNRRSADLQKYKVMMDDEFRVVDVVPDKDGCSVFVMAGATGTFNGVMVGVKEENKVYLANKEEYVGKYVTVQYQRVYRDSGLPQFPIVKCFREVVGGKPVL